MNASDAQHLDCQGQLPTWPSVPDHHYQPVGGDVELLERPAGIFMATIRQAAAEIRLVKDRSWSYQEQYPFYELDRYVTGWLPLQGIAKTLFVTEVPLGLGVASFYIMVMSSVALVYECCLIAITGLSTALIHNRAS
jgi:hypothetical protein